MHYCESCPDPTLMEPASGTAVCPTCGREEPAPTEPFLVVTGASGSGKSTLLHPLARELAGEVAVFDIDSLIAPFNMQANGAGVNWAAVRAAWLSVSHGLAFGGLPTVLLGPLAPFHLQDLRQTRWVRSLHFFLLDCPDAVRRERLEARPRWRGRQRELDIEEQTQWGAWLREHIHEGVDTGGSGVDETVQSVAAWVRTVVAAESRWRNDDTLGAAGRAAALAGRSRSDSAFDELQLVILDELKAQLAMSRDIDDIPEMIADMVVRRFELKRREDAPPIDR